MPLLTCTLSSKVKRLRWFDAPAALFGPAEVMVPLAVVVTPPPTTIPPGPAPDTKESLAGKFAGSIESRAKEARENPAVKVFKTCGEKTCVSRRLRTCIRRGVNDANIGSASGRTLL